jgi:urease accessory protein
VVVFGLLLVAAARTTPSVSLALVGAFALFHGYAHAVAMPQMAPAFTYWLGLLIATAVLQLSGIALGSEFGGARSRKLLRWGGAAIACGGMLLFA